MKCSACTKAKATNVYHIENVAYVLCEACVMTLLQRLEDKK